MKSRRAENMDPKPCLNRNRNRDIAATISMIMMSSITFCRYVDLEMFKLLGSPECESVVER
jgi:hypothetical protein